MSVSRCRHDPDNVCPEPGGDTSDVGTEPGGPITGHGGPWPRGQWTGKGTDGRQAVPGNRAGHTHGYRAYWWYVGLDGEHRGLEYCLHAHTTREAAQACGERRARRLNRTLDRVRGPIEQRYPWRVQCSGCGWVDHFDTEATAQSWADRHNTKTTSWPHDAQVSPRD